MKPSEIFLFIENQLVLIEKEPGWMPQLTDEIAAEMLRRVMAFTNGRESPAVMKDWIKIAHRRIYLAD